MLSPVFLSVPCKPRNIKAAMDCYTKTAQVSWYPSDGALSYLVVASTASGHNVTCETTNTSCELEGLRCGQSYSVWMKSVGETCSSSANMTGELLTGEKLKHRRMFKIKACNNTLLYLYSTLPSHTLSCFTFYCAE